MHRRIPLLAIVAVLLAFPVITGCLTERGKALVERQPTNRIFQPDAVRPMEEGEGYAFYEYDGGGSQNVCVLQLAPDATLAKRYHKRHDLTLLAVSGSAIVQVEESRYFATPGSAIILPAFTAYAVMPHRTEEPFVALMVYSPPYDGEDVVLED
ncbi:MAG: hypothetical protein R6X33_04195 [Candidatus Brocadiia bacterium]